MEHPNRSNIILQRELHKNSTYNTPKGVCITPVFLQCVRMDIWAVLVVGIKAAAGLVMTVDNNERLLFLFYNIEVCSM